MAKQEGFMKFIGGIGDYSFYKSDGEYYIRHKGGASADKIKNGPAFIRVRENNAEFGRASKAGKILRHSLRGLTWKNSFYRQSEMVTKSLLEVIKSDPVNVRGKRTLKYGNLELMNGFDFNTEAHFDSIFKPKYEVMADRASGYMLATIPNFVPAQQVKSPKNATHMRLSLGGIGIDFEAEKYRTRVSGSAYIPLIDVSQVGFELKVSMADDPYRIWLGAVAVDFCQEVNGSFYVLKNVLHTAIKIALAEKY